MTRPLRTRLTGPPNPYEVYFFVACVLVGASSLTGASRPTSIEQNLPPWLRAMWGAFLFGGGFMALLGLFWPGNAVTSIQVKRAGMLFAASGTFVYGLVVAVAFPHSGGGVYISNFAFTLASYWRVLQVSRILTPGARWVRAVDSAIYLVGQVLWRLVRPLALLAALLISLLSRSRDRDGVP
jgi:hypothetical protein